jgi:hypothetical protein
VPPLALDLDGNENRALPEMFCSVCDARGGALEDARRIAGCSAAQLRLCRVDPSFSLL